MSAADRINMEEELAKAIESMWAILKEKLSEEEQDNLTKVHPIISEVDEYGVKGPIGMGLRRFGGHAVDS